VVIDFHIDDKGLVPGIAVGAGLSRDFLDPKPLAREPHETREKLVRKIP
jgi:hypothetical protein